MCSHLRKYPSKATLEDFSHSGKRVDRRRVKVIHIDHKGVRIMLYLITLLANYSALELPVSF